MAVAIIGTIVLVGVFIAVGLWIDRRVSLIPRAEELAEASRKKPLGSDHAPGTAPQAALHIEPERVQRVLEKARCTECKPRPAMVPDHEDQVVYQGKRLRVVSLRCPSCDATRSMYFDIKA